MYTDSTGPVTRVMETQTVMVYLNNELLSYTHISRSTVVMSLCDVM